MAKWAAAAVSATTGPPAQSDRCETDDPTQHAPGQQRQIPDAVVRRDQEQIVNSPRESEEEHRHQVRVDGVRERERHDAEMNQVIGRHTGEAKKDDLQRFIDRTGDQSGDGQRHGDPDDDIAKLGREH